MSKKEKSYMKIDDLGDLTFLVNNNTYLFNDRLDCHSKRLKDLEKKMKLIGLVFIIAGIDRCIDAKRTINLETKVSRLEKELKEIEE